MRDTKRAEDLNLAKGGHYKMELGPECEGAGASSRLETLGELCTLCDGGGRMWFDRRQSTWEVARKNPAKMYNAAALVDRLAKDS